MDWRAFFKRCNDCSVATYTYEARLSSYVKDNTGLNIEQLYQAFKARLVDEIATSLREEGEIETSDYVYVEGGGFLRKEKNDQA